MWKNLFFAAMGFVFGAYVCVVVFVENLSANNAPSQQETNQPNQNQGKTESPAARRIGNVHPNGNAGEASNIQKTTLNTALDRITKFLFDLKITDVLLVFFTYVLAQKTGGLFVETAGMRAAADQQKLDMARSIKATEKAAEAADLSARAIINMELPIIYIDDVNVGPLAEASEFHWANWIIPEIKVTNYGRTPAFIEDVIINASVGFGLPYKPNYITHGSFTRRCVINQNQTKIFNEYAYYNKGVFPDTQEWTLSDNDSWLYIFGKIIYRDFMGHVYEQGFKFIWVGGGSRSFLAVHQPEYHYTRKSAEEQK